MAARQARIEARAVKAVKVEENKATRVLPDAKTVRDNDVVFIAPPASVVGWLAGWPGR